MPPPPPHRFLHGSAQTTSSHQKAPTNSSSLQQGPVPGQSYSRQLKNKSYCKQLQRDATIIGCLGDEMADEMPC